MSFWCFLSGWHITLFTLFQMNKFLCQSETSQKKLGKYIKKKKSTGICLALFQNSWQLLDENETTFACGDQELIRYVS